MDVLGKMELEVTTIQPVHTPLVGFGRMECMPLGTIDLPVTGNRAKKENNDGKILDSRCPVRI